MDLPEVIFSRGEYVSRASKELHNPKDSGYTKYKKLCADENFMPFLLDEWLPNLILSYPKES